jgi:hypothetical protein
MIKLEIISADEKRKINEEYAEVIRLQQELEEKRRQERIEKTTAYIFELAKGKILETKTVNNCEVLIVRKNMDEMDNPSYADIKEAVDNVKALLREAGYNCDEWFHVYSDSWYYKSNKYGYFIINWIKN